MPFTGSTTRLQEKRETTRYISRGNEVFIRSRFITSGAPLRFQPHTTAQGLREAKRNLLNLKWEHRVAVPA